MTRIKAGHYKIGEYNIVKDKGGWGIYKYYNTDNERLVTFKAYLKEAKIWCEEESHFAAKLIRSMKKEL